VTTSWTIALNELTSVFWLYALVFLRIGAFAAMVPAIGETSVPARVKIVAGVAMTAAVAPSLTGMDDLATTWVTAILTETLIGLALGVMLRLFVMCLQIAGTIAAQTVSLSQLLGGVADPVPAIGQTLVVGGLALAVTLGLHIRAIEFVLLSYELFPQAAWPDARLLSGWGVERVSRVFALGFLLAAPFVIVSLLYNLTLGVINRAMPQLMVAFVGAPAITLGGILMLCVTAPLMLAVWAEALHRFLGSGGLP